MSKNIEKQYLKLLKDILDNGVEKQDRTGTGTISVFGRQIRHDMSKGFPLLTTKKMYWKGIVTELLWFLRGDTNIKYLVDNGCNIWNGDAYKNYEKAYEKDNSVGLSLLVARMDGKSTYRKPTKEQFIAMIQADDEFAKKWGDLGHVYGKQWRDWGSEKVYGQGESMMYGGIDQIANLIRELKTNPDSRRLMVTAWNPAELDQMTLPPCHYGFQVYTRELSREERYNLMPSITGHTTENIEGRKNINNFDGNDPGVSYHEEWLDSYNIPTRAISLMWNQRSVDTFLGLPFNIASYALLLEIIAKAVNMVPDELIGNLGDTHLYLNHIEQAKEQIGRELSLEERSQLKRGNKEKYPVSKWRDDMGVSKEEYFNEIGIAKRTREPYPLPTLNINTEFWPTESGECGVGPLDSVAVLRGFQDDNFCKCLLEEDLQLSNYQAHPTIKAPLSN